MPPHPLQPQFASKCLLILAHALNFSHFYCILYLINILGILAYVKSHNLSLNFKGNSSVVLQAK
jgi:hypothetical protein